MSERTEVQVSIDADPVLRGRIAQVDVELRLGAAVDGPTPTRTEQLAATSDRWPLSLHVARGPQTDDRYQLSALAKDASQHVIAAARARSAFVDGRTLELGLRFDAACADRAQDCPAQLSCQQGVCTSAFVPPETLPGSTPEAMAGGAADGGVPSANVRGGGCQGASCPAAQSCTMDNGGCDVLRLCMGDPASAACGPCPDGFVSGIDRSCLPALSGLRVEGALLTPAFSPARDTYALRVPLRSEQLQLWPSLVEPVRLAIDGKPVASGERWSTPAPAVGDARDVSVELAAEGHPGRSLQLQVQRSGEILGYLKAGNAGAGDQFATTLAAAGDTLAVGAPFEDGSARSTARDPDDATKDAGAVYVFVRDANGALRQEAYLKADAPKEGAQFGTSLALSGERLVVGARYEGSGAVYVFERQNGAWSRVSSLHPDSEGGSSQSFGATVALFGDTLAVGAVGETTTADQSGAVYVYERRAGEWTLAQKLKAKVPGTLDWLGSGLGLGDGVLAASATGELRASVAGGGTIRVFARSATGWQETQEVLPPDPTACGFFGATIVLSGNTLATTCWNASVERPSGAVYFYERGMDGMFQPGQVLTAAAAQSGDLFGHAIALDGDNLLVGAPGDRSAAHGIDGRETGTVDASGAAYLFTRQGGTWRELARIKAPEPAAQEGFGNAAALGGGDLLYVGASQDANSSSGVNAMQGVRTAPASGAVHVLR